MNSTTTINAKSPKTSEPATAGASKPADVAGKPTDPKTAEATTSGATPKEVKSNKKEETRRPLTVSFPARTLRQLKLLASVEGVSIASIVISSVTKSIAKRLPAALEAIKSDLGES